MQQRFSFRSMLQALKQWPVALVLLIGGGGAIAIYFFGFWQTLVTVGDKKPVTAVEFGTAFNGIIGTTVTILGLAFLAFAYLDQQRQAEYQKRQAELALFNKLYDDLIEDIKSIQYRKHTRRTLFRPATSELFQGVDALYNYDDFSVANPSAVLENMNLIIVSFGHILTQIKQSSYQDADFQQIMKSKIYFLYLSKFFWPCNHIYKNHRRRLMRREWANAKMMFFKYEKLTLEAYDYLKTNQLISEANYKSDLSSITEQPSHNALTWDTRWQKADLEPTSRLEARLINDPKFGDGERLDRAMAILDSRPIMFIRQVVAALRKS